MKEVTYKPERARGRAPNRVRGLVVSAVAIITSAFVSAAIASEVRHASMEFHGNSYRYEFSVEVDAPIDFVRAVVTDYEHLDRINNDVVQSDVLQVYDTRRLKRRMWINHCILVFCFDLYFIEDVETLDDGSIQTTVLPAQSNFKSGHSLWRIEAVNESLTRISVKAEQTPDFWIPPLVGPIILKRAFMKEVHETAKKIEHEARRVGSE